MTGGPTVWYVAYGSNLDPDRFRHYLEGGRPPGATRNHAGARDPTPWIDTGPDRVPGRLRFAGSSRTWGGGGVAFLDPARGSADHAFVRRYLITLEQFADVWAQECVQAVGSVAVDLDRLRHAGRLHQTRGWYREARWLGVHDGCPVLTFTRPDEHEPAPAAPSAAYREVVARGLAGLGTLTPVEVDAYLAAAGA